MRLRVFRGTLAVFAAVSIACVAPLVACQRASQQNKAAPEGAAAVFQPEERRVGLGVACYVNDQGRYGIASYSVRDVGKPRVPRLTYDDAEMLKRIRRFVKSPSLRFAYTPKDEFLVFNATHGPCSEYYVLNASCNSGFDPVDKLTGKTAFPGPCTNTARPWMPNDRKEGSVPWNQSFDVGPSGA
jgi:hypothetical protein